MAGFFAVALFKSLLILLSLLFVNRFLKFDAGLLNSAENAAARMADWLRTHHLEMKTDLKVAAGFLALGLFVNWYAALDNRFLNAVGDRALDIFRLESWNNVIPAMDSAGRILVYSIMVIAMNRFFKLGIGVVDSLDRRLCGILDGFLLSQGGLWSSFSKNAIALAIAIMVNHYAQIGFYPLTYVTNNAVAAMGMEKLGEGSESRRLRKYCEKERENFLLRENLLMAAISIAEAEGNSEKALLLRGNLEELYNEETICP